MSEVQNKTVIRNFLTALGRGDAAGLRAILAPDAVAVATGTSPLSRSWTADEFISNASLLSSLVPDGIRFEIVSMTAEADRIATEVQGRSTLRTGDSYDNQYCFVATVREGRITLLKEYFCSLLVTNKLVPLMTKAS